MTQAITCIAVDDEPWALTLIEGYIQKIPELRLMQTFEDAIAAGEFMRLHAVGILFVDIQMRDISGLELVASLSKKTTVIFTTAYKKFAFEGFELEAVDYLLKPFSFERFEKAVKKAINHNANHLPAEKQSEEGFFVWSEYKQVKILFSQIAFVEARKDYACFHLLTGRPVLSLMTLKEVNEKLPVQKFIRIHRSYIIAIDKIKQVSRKKIILTSGTELPVGDSYYQSLQAIARS